MAFTFKSKRLGYDNIANGSAAGFERVVPGGGPGDATTREQADTLGSTYIADRPLELHTGQGVSTSNANWTGMPTSTEAPYQTSESSFTSVFRENL